MYINPVWDRVELQTTSRCSVDALGKFQQAPSKIGAYATYIRLDAMKNVSY